MARESAVVAVFEANEDTTEILDQLLRRDGFRACYEHAAHELNERAPCLSFIAAHNPGVIIWDISPPYDEHWTFLRILRHSTLFWGRGLVITTTDGRYLDRLSGAETDTLAILRKPYDLDRLLLAVKAAMPSE